MTIIDNADDMRAWSWARRAEGKTVGFVPTMGALHEGHASLLRASVAQNDVTVLSIFVNPTQFAPTEDFDRYPRTFEADCALAESIGVEAVYAPKASGMYPDGYATYVNVERLTHHLCGASRPHFFRGVCTVVTKLFNAVQPHRAYFGQKDAQQAAVIRRMARDLDTGIEIVVCPIVREPDGLAMSSRNQYLSPEERQRALCLSKSLKQAQDLVRQGERRPEAVKAAVRETIGALRIDYVEVVDVETMEPVEAIQGLALLALAAWAGETRLIDNAVLDASEAPDGAC